MSQDFLPDLPVGPDETVKTDKTDRVELSDVPAPLTAEALKSRDAIKVSNDEFISKLFYDWDGTGLLRPLTCGFPGDPRTHRAWNAAPWPTDTSDESLNWYFCPSLFEPKKDGSYAAIKSQAKVVYVVVLDDVGTKVPLEVIEKCPPTWLNETSPGNYQAGYLFDAPVSVAVAEAFKKELIKGGLCDKGSSGGSARWMRLPCAVNAKPDYGDPPPRCRLLIWEPGRRYSIDQLRMAFQLGQEAAPSKEQAHAAAAPSRTSRDSSFGPSDDRVHLPRGPENLVIAALRQRGLYKKPLGQNKHDITCPWVHEHTDSVDHGTCYFEPDDRFPRGGFKCLHGHGDDLHLSHLLDFLDVPAQAARHKSVIRVLPGELHRIIQAAEEELASLNCYYQRGGLIVYVVSDPGTGQTTIKVLSLAALLAALSKCAVWMRLDGRKNDWKVCDPPQRHVGALYDAEGYDCLLPLAGIARQPHLRADGSLVQEAGYDRQTGMFGVFDARKYQVPNQPSQEQALAALEQLKELFNEFPFEGPEDLSAALAAVLTATLRPSLPVAPMIHIRAPQLASGKSYLAAIIAIFASTTLPSATSFPKDDEECRKLLLAAFLEGMAVLFFDNLTTDLMPHKSLCSALTEEYMTGRILGVSKTATASTRALLLSTGNNVGPVLDMARRTVTINLDPQDETPASREFKGNPLGEIKKNRERYIVLALIIVRAWIAAGRPRTACKPLASYEVWSDLVRQPLLWLGLPDPATRLFEQLAHDPDRELLGRFLASWHAVFGSAPTRIKDAIAKSSQGDLLGDDLLKELQEVMLEIADGKGEINRRRLGRWIARRQQKVVNGLRFERGSLTSSSESWSVKSVSSVLSVPSQPSPKTAS